jgi:hypothetical protein
MKDYPSDSITRPREATRATVTAMAMRMSDAADPNDECSFMLLRPTMIQREIHPKPVVLQPLIASHSTTQKMKKAVSVRASKKYSTLQGITIV